MAKKQEPEVSKNDLAWIKKQEDLMEEGEKIIMDASNEALEYVSDAIENINDKQWRKMVMESQAVEMGLGIGITEYLVPVIYNDMSKNLHKKIKGLNKASAQTLRHIYIGRVVKNIRKGLNERDK